MLAQVGGPGGVKGPNGPDPNYDPSQDPNADWWKKPWEPKDRHGHDPNEEIDEEKKDGYTEEKNPGERLKDILNRFEPPPEVVSALEAFVAGALTVVALVALLEAALPAAVVAGILLMLGVDRPNGETPGSASEA